MNTNLLTKKDKELFVSLIMLGDDFDTALKTVLSEKEKHDNSEFYKFALEN